MRDFKQSLVLRGGVWPWLLTRGPHGQSFEWGQTPGTPRDFRSLDLLRRSIAEQSSSDESFIANVRAAALELLTTDDPELLRRALQVLSVVGDETDTQTMESFLDHQDAGVRKDARASLFERGVKVAVTA